MTASGEVMREQRAHIELERWYRRLLWAYPIGYRRTHGQEILTTLMDSAEPGQRTPNRADVADLLRGALRQWFRLPTGIPAVATAMVVAVALGAAGAVAASWLAWQTAAGLPSNTVAQQIAETVGGAKLTTPDFQRLDDTQKIWRGVHVQELSRPAPPWGIDTAQARLQADGWTLGPVVKHYLSPPRLNEVSYHTFQATRGGLVLTVDARPNSASGHLHAVITPAQPTWEPGAVLLGCLVGVITGWVLTGWTMYRLRRRSLPRRLAAFTLGLTALGLAALPTAAIWFKTLDNFIFIEPGLDPYAILPLCRLIMLDPAAKQGGEALAIGLAILVLAATGRNRTTAQPTATAA
ncbi:hypothetical protein [Salinispora arenicola]|uniref:hypothetical protein n=1 Tax=Salinispora arenicola TaxID=168697 RepID=UPI00207AE7E5|nr:hypothetical protein [Salinispora arenicola]MCN0180111.1 hypothetical protein [Salinispora arenicola]